MRRELVASLDVGSANTRCILSEVDGRGELRVAGMCQRHTTGVRKGLIVDVDACALTIQDTVSSAERMAGASVGEVYIALSPLHVALQTTRGMVTVLGDKDTVTKEDVARVVQATKVISLPPNREIVDLVPRQYIVDGYGGMKDPLHMVGMRLELEATLVVGNLTALSNLRRSVERAGYSAAGFVFKPLALGELLLGEDERELGVQLVDIGAGVTEMAYFEEGILRAVSVVPIGGGNVTNDLALGMKVSLHTAEKLKIEVDWFSLPDDKAFDLQAFGHVESRRVHPRNIIDVVEPRLEELLKLVRHNGQAMSNRDVPSAGVVLTGGATKTKALAGLAKRHLAGAVRVNLETYGATDDPGYNVVVATAAYVVSRQRQADERPPGRTSRGLLTRLRGIWQDFWE